MPVLVLPFGAASLYLATVVRYYTVCRFTFGRHPCLIIGHLAHLCFAFVTCIPSHGRPCCLSALIQGFDLSLLSRRSNYKPNPVLERLMRKG